MASFNFYYGGGKTTDILTRSYSLKETGKKLLISDGNHQKYLQSKVDFKDIDGRVNINYDGDYSNINEDISHIFIDNSHQLSVKEINTLYSLCKENDINVSLYGDRKYNAIRCMELADSIIKLNDFEFLRKGCGLTFYYGTMNSGKTIKLIGNLEYLNDEYNVCLMKPESDREKEYIYSRLGLRKKADYVINSETKILSLADSLKDNNVNFILVDEAQFLTAKQINQLKLVTKDYKIPVLCYGLKTDFQTNSFPGSRQLLKVADSIVKIPGQCACCEAESEFNARKVNGEYINNGEQKAIDGQNCEYDALCPKCYIKKVLKRGVL